jgi:hypothetical protein
VEADRRQDLDIQAVLDLLAEEALPVGSLDDLLDHRFSSDRSFDELGDI